MAAKKRKSTKKSRASKGRRSPLARAAKACKGKTKGKFRACVKKKMRSARRKKR